MRNKIILNFLILLLVSKTNLIYEFLLKYLLKQTQLIHAFKTLNYDKGTNWAEYQSGSKIISTNNKTKQKSLKCLTESVSSMFIKKKNAESKLLDFYYTKR